MLSRWRSSILRLAPSPTSSIFRCRASPAPAPARRSARAGGYVSADRGSPGCAEWPRRSLRSAGVRRRPPPQRSEEHTSELQSQSNLVCRLLLEKKKKKTYQQECENDT